LRWNEGRGVEADGRSRRRRWVLDASLRLVSNRNKPNQSVMKGTRTKPAYYTSWPIYHHTIEPK
jgi:hypothetical protein